MTWRWPRMFRSKARRELDEEVRKKRGELAAAVMTNDRRVLEHQRLLGVMSGALALREGYSRDADR